MSEHLGIMSENAPFAYDLFSNANEMIVKHFNTPIVQQDRTSIFTMDLPAFRPTDWASLSQGFMFMRLMTYPLMYFNILLQIVFGPLQLFRFTWVLTFNDNEYNLYSVLWTVFLRQQYSIWSAVWIIVSEPFSMMYQTFLLGLDILLFFFYIVYYFFVIVFASL